MPIFHLSDDLVFPPPHLATREGLLAVGGDLTPERLLLAYENGIFPWYSDPDPILWWSPNPRMVLFPDELKTSASLKKVIRSGKFQSTMDHAFDQVINQCAATRLCTQEGTWITSEMGQAYCQLHRLGHAHSVETWYEHQLVGGLYGVSLGRCFFGESMFSTMSNASKVALVLLCHFLNRHHFEFIDCQVSSDHLLSMGARNIRRNRFISLLRKALAQPPLPTPWLNDK